MMAVAAKRKRAAEPAPALTIIDALQDPALFAPFFSGDTWSGWNSILKAAFALPMSESETALFNTVAGNRMVPTEAVRELWLIAGRRAGKDSIASAVAAFAAATFNQQNKLRPGERALVMCLAVDRDQARVILNYIRSYFLDIPMLAAMLTRETATGFELNNGIDIAILTNNFRSVRGRAVLLAVFDELAYWRDESSAAPDKELYKAIVPALASIPGSMIIGISSPYRKSGLLYDKFKKHFGQNDDVLVIQAPTRTLNPTIDQKLIDRELADDPAGAAAEWMAEFRNDIGGWLDIALIEAAVDYGVTVRPPLGHIAYTAAADPSGGSGKDSFTCAISHNETGIAMLDCLIEVRPPFNPIEAVTTVGALLRSYDLKEVTGDAYAADWVVSAFANIGVTYQHSERNRSEIYRDAMPLFTSGRARILDNQKLISQFGSLERKTSSMGKDKIDHGPNGHDDLCNAAALAMVLATTAATGPKFFFG